MDKHKVTNQDLGNKCVDIRTPCHVAITPTRLPSLDGLVCPFRLLSRGLDAAVLPQRLVSSDLTDEPPTPHPACCSFFITQQSVGQPRAQVVTELLREMNESVGGDFVEEDVDTILQTDTDFFKSFTVVIATQLTDGPLQKLAALLWEVSNTARRQRTLRRIHTSVSAPACLP